MKPLPPWQQSSIVLDLSPGSAGSAREGDGQAGPLSLDGLINSAVVVVPAMGNVHEWEGRCEVLGRARKWARWLNEKDSPSKPGKLCVSSVAPYHHPKGTKKPCVRPSPRSIHIFMLSIPTTRRPDSCALVDTMTCERAESAQPASNL